jgi:ceramide glucosyltransferase
MIALQLAAAALFLGGFAYIALAIRHTVRHRKESPATGHHPPLTVMIPAYGAAPRLAECLRSVCSQDYPAFQVVFGLHSPDDDARPVIEAVMAEFPHLDTALVIDGHRAGANPKNANLANMLPACRHDVLVMVDSDVLVEPGFLDSIVAPFADPAVGGATCLYSGSPQANLASRLGALYHDDWFIPSVLVDISRREMDICYGAAIAVTRRALEAVGGFQAMADAVAQDFVMGQMLHRHGFKIRLASTVVSTVVYEPSLAALQRHELRWNRAIRAVRPLEHALSVFMSPLVPMAVLALVSWPPAAALAAIGLHLGLRQALHVLVRRRFGGPAVSAWLVPVREALNFVVWARALTGRSVHWAGARMETGHGLEMKIE